MCMCQLQFLDWPAGEVQQITTSITAKLQKPVLSVNNNNNHRNHNTRTSPPIAFAVVPTAIATAAVTNGVSSTSSVASVINKLNNQQKPLAGVIPSSQQQQQQNTLDEITNKVFSELLQGKVESHAAQGGGLQPPKSDQGSVRVSFKKGFSTANE
jgi:hypothetical protein